MKILKAKKEKKVRMEIKKRVDRDHCYKTFWDIIYS